MRLILAVSAILVLVSCVPLNPRQQEPNVPQSISPIETATGELDITPEPFIDPLAPVSLTGATALQERVLSGGILEVGNARARHTMEVFLNVESPYAREFQQSRLPVVLQEFVEPGMLNIRFFILPIRKYAGSDESARHLWCAAEFGKGYPALARMMEAETPMLNAGDVDDLGMDIHLFTVCNTDGRDALAASRIAAERYGVTLVPTYVIDGEMFVGLPSETDLLGAIRAAL